MFKEPQMTVEMKTLVDYVKARAAVFHKQNNTTGWDLVVAADDEDIARLIGPSVKTEKGAVRVVYQTFIKSGLHAFFIKV